MAVATMRVPTIFTAVDRFSSVVSRMSMSASAFGKSAEAAAMRTSRKFNSMGNSMLTTGVAIATGIGYAVNEAAKFEDRIANIGTLIPELNTLELKGVGDKLLEFSKNTSKPIDEITTSFYDLISAGVKLNDAYPLIKSIDNLSIAGLGSLTEATDIQLAAMRNFKTSFKDSDDAANVLFKTVKYGVTTVQKLSEAYSANAGFAGDLGVTGQEFSAGIVGLTATKMPTAQAQVGLGSISNQIGKTTAKRNKILFSIFQKLGVSNGNDLVKKSGGFLPTLTAISREAKKAGINMQSVFSEKRASNTFLKLTSNVDAIKAYNTSLQDLNDKSNDAISVAKKLKEETASFKIGQLKNSMLGLAITIGETLLPRIKDLVDSIIPTIKSFTLWSEENKGFANTLMTISKWFLIAGVSAKVLAFTFGTVGFYLKIVRKLTSWYLKALEFYSIVALNAAEAGISFASSLWLSVAPIMAWLGPLLAVLGLLVSLGWMFNKSQETTKQFAVNNRTHLRVVAGEYESMEERINRSNARMIASMKKFRLDQLSVKNTGMTVAEATESRRKKIVKVSEKIKLESNLSTSRDVFAKNKDFVLPKSNDIISSMYDNKGNEIKKENLAGKNNPFDSKAFMESVRRGGVLEINLNDPNNVIKDVDKSKLGAIPVILSSSKTPAKKPF